MVLNWTDPQVAAALIQTVGGAAAAAFAAIGTLVIGRQVARRKRLEEKLLAAQGDIVFLLEVEAQHCELHKQVCNESFKVRVRRTVTEKGHQWTGRFTPSRIRESHQPKDPAILRIIRERERQRERREHASICEG
jgi:hypothetical protein